MPPLTRRHPCILSIDRFTAPCLKLIGILIARSSWSSFSAEIYFWFHSSTVVSSPILSSIALSRRVHRFRNLFEVPEIQCCFGLSLRSGARKKSIRVFHCSFFVVSHATVSLNFSHVNWSWKQFTGWVENYFMPLGGNRSLLERSPLTNS